MEGFPLVLERIRQQAGLSQADLARAAGVSASYINRMEKGDRPPPSRDVLLRIADSLGLDPEATDSLLLSAGYAPTRPYGPTIEHPVLGLMADMLREGYVPNEEVDLIRHQLELIRRRWKPQGEEDRPPE